MRRRYLALKPASTQWGYAVAIGDQSEATLIKTGFFVRDPELPLAEQLEAILNPLQMTDRLAWALPAQSALVRWLEFPFSEPRKIAAAALPEMARQLPENMEGRIIFQHALSAGKTLVTAVAKKSIETLLDQFDDNHEPLGYLGLAPFCYVAGLDWPSDCLLLCVEADEISLSRIENGTITDLHILAQSPEENEQFLVQQVTMAAHGSHTPLTRLCLLGISTDSPLAQSLTRIGFEIDPLPLDSETGPVSTELTAVASLALAATKDRPAGLNLRSGPYKLKNEWQALKRRIGFAAGLLLSALLIFSGTGYLQYHQRATKLAGLQQQLKLRYQQQFPGAKLRVSAPLQLASKLKELRKKSQQFKTASAGALRVLLAVSKSIKPGLSVDVREYLDRDNELRLSGSTESFDAVSQLLAGLQKEPLFKEVRILDSKQAIDGSRVDFQLQATLNNEQGE